MSDILETLKETDFKRTGTFYGRFPSSLKTAASTTSRSRTRWKSPRGVMFGNEKWYPLDEVKRHLDARASYTDEDDRPVVL